MEKSQETKQKLFDAACMVFREKSYGKAKVSDIVARAEVAQGTFYLYFKSKQDCLNSLVTELITSFLDDIAAEKESLNQDSIYRVVEKILDSIQTHSQVLAIMHFDQTELYDDVLKLHCNVHNEGLGLIRSAFIAKGLSEKTAETKTYLLDALIKQHLLCNVYVFNPLLSFETPDFMKMMKIVIDEVTC